MADELKYISEKDNEFIQKQVSKAIKSYNWEKKVHEVLDDYLDNLYDNCVLDDIFTDFMAKVIQKTLADAGLIEKEE